MKVPKEIEQEEAFQKWFKEEFPVHFDDISKKESEREQAEFLHGGKWHVSANKDQSLSSAFHKLENKHYEFSLPYEVQGNSLIGFGLFSSNVKPELSTKQSPKPKK